MDRVLFKEARDNLQAAYFHFYKLQQAMQAGNIEEFQYYALASITIARSVYHIVTKNIPDKQVMKDWWVKKKDELSRNTDYMYMKDKRDAILKEGKPGIEVEKFEYQIHASYVSKEGDSEIQPLLVSKNNKGIITAYVIDNKTGEEIAAEVRVEYRYFFVDKPDISAANLIWNFIVEQETLIAEFEYHNSM